MKAKRFVATSPALPSRVGSPDRGLLRTVRSEEVEDLARLASRVEILDAAIAA
jgi:hypothetical protein